MQKFKVTVVRTCYQGKFLTVEAENAEQAKQKALEAAPDEEFDISDDSRYSIEDCVPVID